MKALIISKPKEFTKETITPQKLKDSREILKKYMENGIVEHAYAIVGGGSVYLVNVSSREKLTEGLNKNELMKYSDVDVVLLENDYTMS